jgi:hypothetical protein
MVGKFYFQHTMGARIFISEISLNTTLAFYTFTYSMYDVASEMLQTQFGSIWFSAKAPDLQNIKTM